MTTITFEVDDELKARLEDLSGRLHLDAADVLRDALLEKLEELEDFETVRERLKIPHRRIDDATVWRDLGPEVER